MIDKSRRDRVGLGLIGLGPSWEQVYHDTLVRLQNRLTIRLVYDPVEARSRSVADEFQADVAGSLRQMLTRHSLRGFLVLDPGWVKSGALFLIAQSGKPAYLAAPILRCATQLRDSLHSEPLPNGTADQSMKIDDLLMPEFALRFTPASCRLRELIATKLGKVTQIIIDCDLTAEIEELASLVDWCCDIMGIQPKSTEFQTDRSTSRNGITLEFPALQPATSTTATKHRTARLRPRSSDSSSVRTEIECEFGEAILLNRTHIAWKTPSESRDESLTEERTEIEILIDQFCRRALGGLNPVGRLSDFARAIQIVESIRNQRD